MEEGSEVNPVNNDAPLDSGILVSGFVLGLLFGAVLALFKTPNRSLIRQQLNETGENLRQKLESVVPSDPIAESLAEGKAAARRRRTELGLPNP